jgi:NodT family efflux transporter outer membrane factor (OMF) lipoprotein
MKFPAWPFLLAAAVTVFAGCAVGPDYKRPDFDVAAHYREQDGWKPSAPNDVLDRGPWWQIFEDPMLDDLERQVEISNENVKAAAAAVEQARALVNQSRAGFWPTIGVTADRQRTTTNPLGAGPVTHTVNSAGVNASWDIDVWGQIRRSTESSRANAQASEATLAAARLSAQAQLASTYFELRAQDQLQTLLDDTVKAQQQSLKIAESRYRFGVAAKADVVAAQTQLLASQAQQVNAPIQRAILQHAIAVLIGKQPANFSVERGPMRSDVPSLDAGLPSTLLERRPDIAAAERRVAAASAQIGVARAAFFPSVTLSGSDTYSGNTVSRLISASNRVWAFGPALALTVFDGGLRHAQVSAARASFDISVDSYRQAVLTAFQQVEDQIVTLHALEQQAIIEDATVKYAKEAESLTLNQYKAGTVPYSSVITAQTTRLSSEVNALTVLSNRLTASVTLIEALGGGWSASRLR